MKQYIITFSDNIPLLGEKTMILSAASSPEVARACALDILKNWGISAPSIESVKES